MNLFLSLTRVACLSNCFHELIKKRSKKKSFISVSCKSKTRLFFSSFSLTSYINFHQLHQLQQYWILKCKFSEQISFISESNWRIIDGEKIFMLCKLPSSWIAFEMHSENWFIAQAVRNDGLRRRKRGEINLFKITFLLLSFSPISRVSIICE